MDAVVVWFSTFQKTGERIQPCVVQDGKRERGGELRAESGEKERQRGREPYRNLYLFVYPR